MALWHDDGRDRQAVLEEVRRRAGTEQRPLRIGRSAGRREEALRRLGAQGICRAACPAAWRRRIRAPFPRPPLPQARRWLPRAPFRQAGRQAGPRRPRARRFAARIPPSRRRRPLPLRRRPCRQSRAAPRRAPGPRRPRGPSRAAPAGRGSHIPAVPRPPGLLECAPLPPAAGRSAPRAPPLPTPQPARSGTQPLPYGPAAAPRSPRHGAAVREPSRCALFRPLGSGRGWEGPSRRPPRQDETLNKHVGCY